MDDDKLRGSASRLVVYRESAGSGVMPRAGFPYPALSASGGRKSSGQFRVVSKLLLFRRRTLGAGVSLLPDQHDAARR